MFEYTESITIQCFICPSPWLWGGERAIKETLLCIIACAANKYVKGLSANKEYNTMTDFAGHPEIISVKYLRHSICMKVGKALRSNLFHLPYFVKSHFHNAENIK